jgi:molybdopterin-guanine dinucleotide biosynthesis protein
MTNKSPIILEIFGVPASGKTTSLSEVEKILSEKRIRYKSIVNEFRENKQLYESLKSSYDINLLRSSYLFSKVLEFSNSRKIDIILVERGFIDTLAWIEFFKDSSYTNSKSYIEESMNLVNSRFISKYYAAWIDTDPSICISRRPNGGRFSNLSSIQKLQISYEKVMTNIHRPNNLKIRRFCEGEKKVQDIARNLVRYCKITNHATK